MNGLAPVRPIIQTPELSFGTGNWRFDKLGRYRDREEGHITLFHVIYVVALRY